MEARSDVPHLLKEQLVSIMLSKGHEPPQNRVNSRGKGPGTVTSLIQKADGGLGFIAPQRRLDNLTIQLVRSKLKKLRQESCPRYE